MRVYLFIHFILKNSLPNEKVSYTRLNMLNTVSAAIKFKWPLQSKLSRKIACVIIIQMSQLCYLAWIFTEAPSSVLNYIAFLGFLFLFLKINIIEEPTYCCSLLPFGSIFQQ